MVEYFTEQSWASKAMSSATYSSLRTVSLDMPEGNMQGRTGRSASLVLRCVICVLRQPVFDENGTNPNLGQRT